MPNSIPLVTAVAGIPDFNGNPQTLQAFSKVLKDILRTYGPSCEQFLLNSIPKRLKSRAYDAFAGITPNYTSLDVFLQDLKLSFGGIIDIDTIKIDLRQAVQKYGESTSDFSIRIQNLEQALIAAYDSLAGLSEKISWKSRANKEALECFLLGIRNPVGWVIAAKKPANVREAANIALNINSRNHFHQ